MRFSFSNMRRPAISSGFTLIELLLVMTIVALLLTISFPAFSYLKNRAANAACTANLRGIGTGLTLYLQDHDNIWPQVPESVFDREQDESMWWEATLREYGVARKDWICPADTLQKQPGRVQNKDEFISSYAVTLFDELPQTAYRWKQPWVIERGSPHGSLNGPNMVMPDGSIAQGLAMPVPSGR
ncbi:MAG: type II secretion system GspH family protein [Verrucomicrobia bacterium]|nr:type II secretion system GspH family protein [Verrucomicrobiota bacterium]